MTFAQHEPLLSSEETDALLAAVRASAGMDEPKEADLASEDRPLREALVRAIETSRGLVQKVPKLFLRLVAAPSKAEEYSPEILPSATFQASIEPGTLIASLRAPDGGLGILTVGPQLAAMLLARRFGGAVGGEGQAALEPCLRFSTMDRKVLTPILEALAEEFSNNWNHGKPAFKLEKVASTIAEAKLFGDAETLLRVSMRLQITNGPEDTLSFVLGVPAVLETCPRQAPVVKARPPEERNRMAERIESAEVEVVAVLGTARSTIRRLIDLSVGDVIRLDQVPETPIHLLVEGSTVLRGQPIVHHGNLSIEISETV